MKKHIILFEIFGKKMKAIVNAYDIDHAKLVIKNKLIFHKITEEKTNTFADFFKDITGGLKNK